MILNINYNFSCANSPLIQNVASLPFAYVSSTFVRNTIFCLCLALTYYLMWLLKFFSYIFSYIHFDTVPKSV